MLRLKNCKNIWRSWGMWGEVFLNNCCEILDNRRVPLNEDQRSLIFGNIPYYGANGVQGYINQFIFDEPLILIAEDGGYFEEYDKRPIAYRVIGKSWVNNHAHVLRAKTGYDQDYIFYSLVNKNILPYIKGGTRTKLNQSELKEIFIRCPEKKVQAKISKILNKIHTTIEKTETLITKYEQIKQGMMQDLFIRGVDENGKLRPSYTDAPHLYKNSLLGMIPREWRVDRLDTLYASPIRDFGSFSMTNLIEFITDGIPFIKSEAVQEGYLDYSNMFYISKKIHRLLYKSVVNKDDILFTKIGSVCRSAIYDGSLGQCNSNAATAKIRISKEKGSPEFVNYTLLTKEVAREFEKFIISTPPRINLGDINALCIKIPGLKEQIKIAYKLKAIDKLIFLEKNNLSKFQLKKIGLMQDLLTGKVRVKVDDKEFA